MPGPSFYNMSGLAISSIACGQPYTFNVPGYSSVWLDQYQNGSLQYSGPINVPMPPYTGNCSSEVGAYNATAYTLVNGQRGSIIGSTLFTIQPPNTGTAINPAASSTPGGPNPGVAASVSQAPTVVYTQAAVAAATAPSIPSGLPSGTGSAVGGQMLSTTYRFILATGGGYATGANLEGCSQTNSGMCDPQFFNTLQQAIAYAIQQGQVPYQVLTANDPWQLMAGTMAINPAQIYNSDGSLGGSGSTIGGIPIWMLAAAGVAAYLLTR